jgi:hypothetical protein
MAKVCIICEQERSGHPVENDIVINTIRWFKMKTGTAKNNTLVVCDGCLPAHKAKREKFEKSLVTHVILAAVILLLLLVLPLLAGAGVSVYSLLLGILLAALIIGFAGIYHWPRTSDNAEKGVVAATPGKAGAAQAADEEPAPKKAPEKKTNKKR